MKTLQQMLKVAAVVCAAWMAVLLAASPAMADKVTLKDGSVLDGNITREGDQFIFVEVRVGGIKHQQIVMRDQIASIERDGDTPTSATSATSPAASAGRPADKGVAAAAAALPGTHPSRVAVLNFGPPSSWQGEAGNMVGLHISADSFKKVIPLLEREKVDIVVIRINSGGGYGSEMARFRDVFLEYQKKFRTVTWIESAISCAAMSPWVIKEQYMMPHGNIGACTGWYGRLVAVKGVELEEMLYDMEKVSELAGRSPLLMRAMQIEQPLSASVDPVTGVVTYYPDVVSGDIVLNDGMHILTLTSDVAEKIKFSSGTAATLDELMKVMGVPEYEVVGEQASKKIDEYMRGATRLEHQRDELLQKYVIALAAIQALPGDENKTRRGAEIGRARRHLNELRQLINLNPNFAYMQEGGLPPEWFEAQERMLRELAQ